MIGRILRQARPFRSQKLKDAGEQEVKLLDSPTTSSDDDFTLDEAPSSRKEEAEDSPGRLSPPAPPADMNDSVKAEAHVRVALPARKIHRSMSHDSFSTITTAPGAPEGSYNMGFGVGLDYPVDWALPPSEICLTTTIAGDPTQRSNLIVGPRSARHGQGYGEYDNPHDTDGHDSGLGVESGVLLSRQVFSTLGMPMQANPRDSLSRLQKTTLSPSRRTGTACSLAGTIQGRPMLRRSSSGGLDPYLTAPNRMTRFEI